MASVELSADDLTAIIEVRDGHRVLVLGDDSGAEAVLRLPDRDPWGPTFRASLLVERLAWELKAQSAHDFHRGGLIIAARAPEDGHGGWLSGAC